jgi:hypothetical protein
MGTALKLAMEKAADLPEAAQEQLGRELLERIDALIQLRAEVEIGIRELDAGLGEELDIEKLVEQLRSEHAGYSDCLVSGGQERCSKYLAVFYKRRLR